MNRSLRFDIMALFRYKNATILKFFKSNLKIHMLDLTVTAWEALGKYGYYDFLQVYIQISKLPPCQHIEIL